MFYIAGGISGAADKAAICFRMNLEARTIAVRQALELREEGISDAALRPDGRVFAVGGWDGRVRLYSYRKAAPLAILKACPARFGWHHLCRRAGS